MPFKSKAQRGFMYAKHPKLAKRFEDETPKGMPLPEHVKDRKKMAMKKAMMSDRRKGKY